MDLRYSEEDEEFRAHARAWLRAHVPQSSRPPRGRAAADFDRAWQRKLYEHGWAGIAWPAEYGETGVMTFQVSHQGDVLEADLGPDTAEIAAAMDAYDPDPSWTEVTD